MLKAVIGSRVKQSRFSCGFTQKEVAEHLGVTPTQISDIENEKTLPSLARAVMLANFFDVSIDYLTGKTDIAREPKRAQEESLIVRVRNLPDDAKKRLEGYLDGMGY